MFQICFQIQRFDISSSIGERASVHSLKYKVPFVNEETCETDARWNWRSLGFWLWVHIFWWTLRTMCILWIAGSADCGQGADWAEHTYWLASFVWGFCCSRFWWWDKVNHSVPHYIMFCYSWWTSLTWELSSLFSHFELSSSKGW